MRKPPGEADTSGPRIDCPHGRAPGVEAVAAASQMYTVRPITAARAWVTGCGIRANCWTVACAGSNR